jgi:ubiquitin C-terminal hydrolase
MESTHFDFSFFFRNCDKCKADTVHQKQIDMRQASKYLIIVLKRFTHVAEKQITLPVPIIPSRDLSIQTREGNQKFALYAMSLFFNQHYYSYLLNRNHDWYCANDSIVKKINWNQVKTDATQGRAYILFYEHAGR